MDITGPPSTTATRARLRACLAEAWALTDLLFGTLREERSFGAQPDPLRSPLIFYFGHPAAFYVNKLRLAGLLSDGPDPRLDELFARGVDPNTPDQLAARSWPPLAEVRAWRDRARSLIEGALDRLPEERPIGPDHPGWALLMGLEHERIHFETSSVLLRQLPTEALSRPDGWRDGPRGGAAPEPAWLAVPGGVARLGRPDEHPTFGWDNEYGRQEVRVAPFEATRDLVTNAALLEFVQDGGYRRAGLWSAQGWSWRERVGATRPRFWLPDGDGFAYRAMFDLHALPTPWPAEVNAHEAEAFCRWVGHGARLPTEAEHHLLAAGAPTVHDDVIEHPGYNLNLRFGSPTPVGFTGARSALGFRDTWGNVWQWLADDFSPLPGFAPNPLYADFSAPYFDDQHAALIGGAWASTGTSASRFYRLWFRRHFFQHAGFRLARDV